MAVVASEHRQNIRFLIIYTDCLLGIVLGSFEVSCSPGRTVFKRWAPPAEGAGKCPGTKRFGRPGLPSKALARCRAATKRQINRTDSPLVFGRWEHTRCVNRCGILGRRVASPHVLY